eukprot:jgi/Chrzof1/10214/Cz04g32280.t1
MDGDRLSDYCFALHGKASHTGLEADSLPAGTVRLHGGALYDRAQPQPAARAKEHVNPLDMLIKLFGPFEAAAGSGGLVHTAGMLHDGNTAGGRNTHSRQLTSIDEEEVISMACYASFTGKTCRQG